jgi:hypothetical protein
VPRWGKKEECWFGLPVLSGRVLRVVAVGKGLMKTIARIGMNVQWWFWARWRDFFWKMCTGFLAVFFCTRNIFWHCFFVQDKYLYGKFFGGDSYEFQKFLEAHRKSVKIILAYEKNPEILFSAKIVHALPVYQNYYSPPKKPDKSS